MKGGPRSRNRRRVTGALMFFVFGPILVMVVYFICVAVSFNRSMGDENEQNSALPASGYLGSWVDA